ncbi:MAG: hypothetical protein GF349_04600 [Candidatus Magasanikbacteria bacterium]|nr:hypothetical protein [Candidatus Magasanikbacteria bacterium]
MSEDNEIMIGLVAGSGFDMESSGVELQKMPDVEFVGKIPKADIITPYGAPSSDISILRVRGVLVAVILRHGEGHQLPPHLVPYRANSWIIKALGAHIHIQFTAVGSLQDHINYGDVAVVRVLENATERPLPDLLEDVRVAIHPSLAEQTCDVLPKLASEAFRKAGVSNVHQQAAHVTIPGPAFAPKFKERQWKDTGYDLIGMTSVRPSLVLRQLRQHWVEIAIPTDSSSIGDDEEVNALLVSRRMKGLEQLISTGFCNFVEVLGSKLHLVDCACHWPMEVANMSKKITVEAERRLILSEKPHPYSCGWSKLIS